MQETAGRAGAVLTIDLQALRHNYRYLRSQLAKAECGAVVKADAYGVGMAQVAPVLAEEGCRHFFVAHLDEAIALRRFIPAGAAVYIMHGSPVDHEAEVLAHGCIPVLNSLRQIAAWRNLATTQQRALDAIVQVDTGMTRMGLSAHEMDSWMADSRFFDGIELRYLMSHLACAETQEHVMNQQQLKRFEGFLRTLHGHLPRCGASLANSSGVFLGNSFQFDLVRPGAALYGVAPVAGKPNPMRPVVNLRARIIQTQEIAARTGIGYGQTYCAAVSRRIATIAVGYADGWLRSLSNRGHALIGGTRVPIVGRVSMDTMTLDVSEVHAEYLFEGAMVELLSAAQTVDDVAGEGETIGYEILTSLGARYERRYID